MLFPRSPVLLDVVYLVVGAISMGLLFMQITTYDPSILETITKTQNAFLTFKLLDGVGRGLFVENPPLPWTGKVLLPAGFDFDFDVIRKHVQGTASADWPILQVAQKQVVSSPDMPESQFITHEPVPLFHAGRHEDQNNCDDELKLVMDKLQVDSRKSIPGNLSHVFEILMEELETYNDPYYNEIKSVFLTHLKAELKTDMINQFWFRALGLSVWLKDHAVHLVVLRFAFSERRQHDFPKASFMLAQVFDKNWKELRDVRLVFPTNDLGSDTPGFKVGSQHFFSYRFPRLIPIPFYQGLINMGPEDPRAFLIRNKNGYDEPAVVVNTKHKKSDKEFRSVFTCFPFQLRKGKIHVEDKYSDKTDNQIFTKIVEMKILHREKLATNKNWTPFVSSTLRHTLGYDPHIYFSTQLDHLQVLQCDLVNDTGDCEVVHEEKGDVGPMRGGTPYININMLLEQQTSIPVDQIIPPGREIYVAFARAHLKNCGCGSKFYRPNLLVMTRDLATYTAKDMSGKNEEMERTFFKLSHVSSYMSLHVPIDPWTGERPYKVCDYVSAVIPNGISNWQIDSLDVEGGRWKVKDKLTITFTVSDFTVERVNLKGILDVVLNSDDGTLVLPPPTSNRPSFITRPKLDSDGNIVAGNIGFSGRNVQCALERSHEFCQKFAESEKSLEEENRAKDNSEAMKAFNEKLKVFEKTLKEQEEMDRNAE